MSQASDHEPQWEKLRSQIIGLGERSIRKSYYPELRHRLEELEHFRQLLDLSNDLILSFELPSNRITQFNRCVPLILGYSPQQMVTLRLSDLSPDLATQVREQCLVHQPSQPMTASNPIITYLITRTGEPVPIEATFGISSMYSRTVGIVVARQIAERLRAEKRLKESETRYRQVIENADEAIFVLQSDRIRFANRQTTSILPISEENLYTIRFAQIFHPSDQDQAQRLSDPDQILEANLSHFLLRFSGQDGDIHWIEVHPVAIVWEGKPATLNFARDITQSKHLEEQLRQSRKMEAIGTLTGGISHDFNNLLGVIIGNLELILDYDQIPQEIRQKLTEIHRAGLRARDVVRQLLRFSRKSDIDRKPLDPVQTSEEAIRLLRASIPTSIDLELRVDGKVGPILADMTQFQQVIINLGTNAFHAMQGQSEGKLSLTLRDIYLPEGLRTFFIELPPGRYLEMVFSDTGCGIKPEKLHRIFDPYFTTKAPGQGTGMGLAVVHGIVQSHGGGITVKSDPGRGTTFWIYFPSTEKKLSEKEEQKAAPEKGTGRILFIDDEPALVELGRAVLEALGYHVVTTTRPSEALKLFSEEPYRFDVVITDLTMPEMSGDRLAKEMCALRPDIPVILCTGYSTWSDSSQPGGSGIRMCLQKPVRMAELAKALHSVLNTPVDSGKPSDGTD